MTASALKSFQPDIHVGKVKLTNSFVIHLRQNALFYKYGKDNICMIVSFHNINCESNLCFIFSIRARHLLRPYYIGELYLVLNQMLLGYLIKHKKYLMSSFAIRNSLDLKLRSCNMMIVNL